MPTIDEILDKVEKKTRRGRSVNDILDAVEAKYTTPAALLTEAKRQESSNPAISAIRQKPLASKPSNQQQIQNAVTEATGRKITGNLRGTSTSNETIGNVTPKASPKELVTRALDEGMDINEFNSLISGYSKSEQSKLKSVWKATVPQYFQKQAESKSGLENINATMGKVSEVSGNALAENAPEILQNELAQKNLKNIGATLPYFVPGIGQAAMAASVPEMLVPAKGEGGEGSGELPIVGMLKEAAHRVTHPAETINEGQAVNSVMDLMLLHGLGKGVVGGIKGLRGEPIAKPLTAGERIPIEEPAKLNSVYPEPAGETIPPALPEPRISQTAVSGGIPRKTETKALPKPTPTVTAEIPKRSIRRADALLRSAGWENKYLVRVSPTVRQSLADIEVSPDNVQLFKDGSAVVKTNPMRHVYFAKDGRVELWHQSEPTIGDTITSRISKGLSPVSVKRTRPKIVEPVKSADMVKPAETRTPVRPPEIEKLHTAIAESIPAKITLAQEIVNPQKPAQLAREVAPAVEPVSFVTAQETNAGAKLTEPPTVASVKNAVTSKRRAELGLSPLEKKPTTPEAKRLQTAQDLIDSGAIDPNNLASEVVANPRPLDLTETDVMKHHLANLEKQLTATRIAGKDTKPLELQFDTATKATRLAGTEQGRALQARADEIDPYSLERLLQKGRENRPDFGKQQEQSVITLHQKLQAGQLAEDALKTRLRQAKRVVIKRPEDFKSILEGDTNTVITKDMWQAARARNLERMSRLNTGVDPMIVADLAVEIGYHVERGARFSYKVMRDYLKKEYGADDKAIQEAYSQVMNDKRLKQSIEYQRKLSEDLKQSIDSKTAPAKVPPIEYNNEWVKLHRQNVELRSKLDSIVNPTKPLGVKVRDMTASGLNATTGILASWDDSFVGRQGAKMLAHQPRAWAKGAKDSLRALRSEPVTWSLDAAITEDPKFALAQKSGLEYTSIEPTSKLASAEEGAMYLRSVEQLPVVGKAAGKLARPFDRAYTTAANTMRHDAFYRMVDAKKDSWTAADYQSYAGFLNKLTGRGDLGRLSSLQPELSGIFISSRKIAADTQLLLTPFTGTKAVRLEAAKTLVRYTGALTALALVVNASGKAKISLNISDPDFMKLRVGDTRFDLTGGEGTLLRTIYKAGKATFDYSRYGKAKYGQATPSDVVLRYLGYKTSPGIQALKSLATGKDYIGEPITPLQVGKNLVTPWNVNDITEAWQSDGAGLGITAGIAGFWGLSAQTYKEKARKPETPAWKF
jgi:hypothetical protein